jgi:urease accessory protein
LKVAINTKLLAVVMALLLPREVWAHHFMEDQLPQTFVQGLLSGLAHPVIGLDHLAFIIATGFLLALVRHGVWGVIALTLGSLLGAALHLIGSSLPGGEVMVALSVILIGGLVTSGRRITLPWLAGGLMLAGVLHGHAYAESIFGAEPTPLGGYLIGFCSVQLGIGVAALLLHRHLRSIGPNSARPISSALGAVVSLIGVVFLASKAIG